MTMNEFFTWPTLATFAGCTLATAAFTQFFKELPGLKNIPTRIVTYCIALAVLIAANAANGTLDVPAAGLCVINAVLVAFAANGGYDAIYKAVSRFFPADGKEEGDEMEQEFTTYTSAYDPDETDETDEPIDD